MKMGCIWDVTKGMEVRKHLEVMDKIAQQLVFYDIIDIGMTLYKVSS